MATRQDLHKLLDELPDDELRAAERYLKYLRDMGDSLLRMLSDALEDDEPETEEERTAVAEAKADIGAGRVVLHATLKDEIGQ